MKPPVLPFILFILYLTSCHKNTTQTLYGIPVETIDFHSFNMKSLEEIPSTLLGEKHYIPLTAGSTDDLFARARKIRIKNDKIYIYDQRGIREYYLLVYDKQGNALGRVGQRGDGPEEYIHITDFDVDSDGTVFIMDAYMGRVLIHEYNPEHEYVRKLEVPFNADEIKCLPDNKFMFSLSEWNSGLHAGKRIMVTDHNLNILYTGLGYDEYVDPLITYFYHLTEDKGNIFLHRPIEDYVYVVSREGELNHIYEIDFGRNKVPLEARKDIEKYTPYFDQYIFLRGFVVINDKVIAAKINDRNQIRFLIADRITNTCYISDNIQDSEYTWAIGYEDSYIISYIESDRYTMEPEIFDHLPSEIKTHLLTDNPVLCLRKIH